MAIPVVPYKQGSTSKKEQVAVMFNSISRNYDFLNHFLSFGIDILWRKKAIRQLRAASPKTILDVATGTGDFAIEALSLNPEQVTGVDISEGMLEIGRKKLAQKGLSGRIVLKLGDSERLQFADNIFDAAIVAFGVRNFENLTAGLADMLRVVKPGGQVVILEFSKPQKFPVKQVYNFYFKYVLPIVGKIVSRDRSAYQYLPESVQAFPDGEDFLAILKDVGFKNTTCIPLTFGVSSIYKGTK